MWISTKDKLPKVNTTVLGWLVSECGDECVTARWTGSEFLFSSFVFQRVPPLLMEATKDEISHWQKLPSGPGENPTDVILIKKSWLNRLTECEDGFVRIMSDG